MWTYCLESAVVSLALLYWSASLVVLIFRLVWPEFRQLAAYGGHGDITQCLTRTNANAASFSKAANHSTGKMKKRRLWVRACMSTVMAAVQRSPLGAMRVTRQQSFTAFYLTGVATSLLLLLLLSVQLPSYHRTHTSSPTAVVFVPSLLFVLHCTVRLAETRWVQRYRHGDTVTLFAAVAGSTFYTAAAVSSMAPLARSGTQPARWLSTSPRLQVAFALGAVAHLVVQAVQVMTHTILARLRAGPSVVAQCSNEKDVWRLVRAALSTPATTAPGGEKQMSGEVTCHLHGAWSSYHFPYHRSPVFRVVLDPHYTCEVLLYLVNTSLILLCTLPYTAPRMEEGVDVWLWGSRCASVDVLTALASAAVTLFTLLNLGITAAEHRRFWEASNTTRREVAMALAAVLQDDTMGATSPLPPRLKDAAARMREGMSIEELPRWNILPFVW